MRQTHEAQQDVTSGCVHPSIPFSSVLLPYLPRWSFALAVTFTAPLADATAL